MDNDVYGHLNNVVAYSLFDTAVNQTLIEDGALEIERSPVIGLVVETACQYLAPMVFPTESAPACGSPGSARAASATRSHCSATMSLRRQLRGTSSMSTWTG